MPADFVKYRKSAALVFTDQVPVWIAREGRRTVFAAHEKVRHSKESRAATGGKAAPMRIQDIQGSQIIPEKIKELAAQQAAEGMSQCRSGGYTINHYLGLESPLGRDAELK